MNNDKLIPLSSPDLINLRDEHEHLKEMKLRNPDISFPIRLNEIRALLTRYGFVNWLNAPTDKQFIVIGGWVKMSIETPEAVKETENELLDILKSLKAGTWYAQPLKCWVDLKEYQCSNSDIHFWSITIPREMTDPDDVRAAYRKQEDDEAEFRASPAARPGFVERDEPKLARVKVDTTHQAAQQPPETHSDSAGSFAIGQTTGYASKSIIKGTIMGALVGGDGEAALLGAVIGKAMRRK